MTEEGRHDSDEATGPSRAHADPKAAVRATALAARAALTADARTSAAAQICAGLLRMPEVTSSRTIVAFAPLPYEVGIEPFLRDRIAGGVGVFLPFVEADGRLGISRVRDLDADLAPGWRGVREPRRDRRRHARVDRVETFVVPGTAFDVEGGRLGYGGGHFDRLLAGAASDAHIVGVAFEVQIVDHVPVAPHDVRMHRIVTERRTLRCRLPRPR